MNDEVREACQQAILAYQDRVWFGDSTARAILLDGIAAGLDARRGDVLDIAAEETRLTIDELVPEFARMTGTLRMFAGLVRDKWWKRPAITRPLEDPDGAIGPNHDVRRMLIPIGPVAVFGASNFPLAYGVCGGDTVSALAAGCPVIVKEHPAHPQTGRLIASIAQQVHKEQDRRNTILPLSVLGYVHNEDPRDLSIGQELVQDSLIMAVGFTGSFRAGMALDELCRARERPIPVFAEMGSCNPVYVTARAGRKRGREIADQLADSILSRHGQQCTKPGLIFVEELTIDGKALRDRLVERFSSAAGRDMLAPWIRDSYQARVAECTRVPGVARLALGATGSSERSAPAVLLATEYEAWRKNKTLQDEIFGPATILVDKVAGQMGANYCTAGHLVCSWYLEPEDYARDSPFFAYDRLPTLGTGRIVINGVPTGVRVAPGMVHGGPFPATNRPDSTAVGPLAIERWCRPVCFQNCPEELLPPELRNPVLK